MENINRAGFGVVEAMATLAAVTLAGLAATAVTGQMATDVQRQSSKAAAVSGFNAVESVLSKSELCPYALIRRDGEQVIPLRIDTTKRQVDLTGYQIVFPDLKTHQPTLVLADTKSPLTLRGPIPLTSLGLQRIGDCNTVTGTSILSCGYQLSLTAATQIKDQKAVASIS
jgi:hypothetical protein